MKKRGFTLIELIVVMVIIGILVLLATPKFLNYIEMAKITQIIHDVKVAENIALAEYIKTGNIPEGFELLEDENIIVQDIEEGLAYNTSGKINSYNSKYFRQRRMFDIFADDGKLEEDNIIDINKQYYRIPRAFVKGTIGSKLKGEFIINADMEGIYMDKFIPEEEDIENIDDSIFTFKFYETYEVLVDGDKFKDRTLEDLRDISENRRFGLENENINYKIESKERTCSEGHDDNMKAVVVGLKSEIKSKDLSRLDFPDTIICNCGKILDVVAIDQGFDGRDNKETISRGDFNDLNLSSVYFGKNIEYIGPHTFHGNISTDRKLTKVILGKAKFPYDSKLKVIAPYGFYMTEMESIYLPNSLEVIDLDAFRSIYPILDSDENGNYIERKCMIQNFKNLDQLIYIGPYAFSGISLEFENQELIIPDSVQIIGSKGFESITIRKFPDKQIKKLKLPKNSSYKYVAYEAFSGRIYAEEVSIPDNIIYLDYGALSNSISEQVANREYLKRVIVNGNLNQEQGKYCIDYNFEEAYKLKNKPGIYERELKNNDEIGWYYLELDESNPNNRELIYSYKLGGKN